jgi:hypothetical protein
LKLKIKIYENLHAGTEFQGLQNENNLNNKIEKMSGGYGLFFLDVCLSNQEDKNFSNFFDSYSSSSSSSSK